MRTPVKVAVVPTVGGGPDEVERVPAGGQSLRQACCEVRSTVDGLGVCCLATTSPAIVARPTVTTTVATLGRTTVPKLLGDRSSDVTPTTLAPLTSVPTICRRPGLRRSLIALITPGHADGEHGGLYGGHREQRHVAVLRR